MVKEKRTIVLILFSLFIVYSCSKEDSNPHGFVDGIVVDAKTNLGLEAVEISIFDSNTNLPIRSTLSDADGKFFLEILPGSYFLRMTKQGYQDIPPKGISPVPFSIMQEATETVSYAMQLLGNTNSGCVEGIVYEDGNGIAGALVIIENSEKAFSTYSNHEGKFSIYNVDAGDYKINAWVSGYNSDYADISISSNLGTTNVPVIMSSGASGVFKGQVRNLSAENKDVDIALVHKMTKEVIPGLTTFSSNQSFEIQEIPNGVFVARATYENDDRVMDPDRVAKFGEPQITINNDLQEITFDITNSVSLKAPTNAASEVIPIEISSTTPIFEWNAYSSSSDYVIEVSDVNGNVIWGGFRYVNELPIKNIVIPSSQKAAEFNYDGSATISSLEPGNIYRWKIFASKNDTNSPTGWTLISASEDQRGIIKILE